ncbi:MAG: tetratricopeptide repeat protein [Sphingomicrobium sp.]
MRAVFLCSAAFALMGMAPTGAAVISVGGNSAQSCYNAAAARDASANAMRDCNTALGQDVLPYTDLVASYVNRGVLRLIQADYRSAESDFDRAMALQPSQAEAWLNKGIARYQMGDTKAAVVNFDRAIELRTRFAALAYFGRGLANEDNGDIKAAYADLKHASQLNPEWDAPRQELTRFQVRKHS